MNPTNFAAQMLDDVKLESFAQAVVRSGSATQAYRDVFDPERANPNTTAWARGCQLNARPDVSRRVHELRAAALATSQISVQVLIEELRDIATADPMELSRTVVTNCRHCHGHEHKYQWIDVEEFVTECDRIAADDDARREASKTGRIKATPLPSDDGGFGYETRRDPHPMCPQCMGAGHLRVLVPDVTTLSHKAAKLYKGVKQKGDGSIEILMHDQLAARDQLHRLLGAYKDTLAVNAPPAPEVGKSAGDVHRSYLTMIQGGRAA